MQADVIFWFLEDFKFIRPTCSLLEYTGSSPLHIYGILQALKRYCMSILGKGPRIQLLFGHDLPRSGV